MFLTAKVTSFSLPTVPCGAAKPWAVISWSSMPCSTSTTSTPAALPSATNEQFPVGHLQFVRLSEEGRTPPFRLQDSVTMLPGGSMSKSRMHFLTQTSLGLLGAAVAANTSVQVHADEPSQDPTQLPPGAPPAFGTGPAVGPEVSPATFAEAEKLVQVQLSSADRAMAAQTWRVNLASVYERRTGPRTIALEPTLAPWSRYHSVLPGQPAGPQRDQFIRTEADPGPLPSNDGNIAFAPVTQLSRWIEIGRASCRERV